jgi:hypothetical protein
MVPPPFDRSIFINAPFDDLFAPMLQAVTFCVTDLDFFPRLAPENADNAANRLDRIVELIRESRYAIHDLSRCKAGRKGEYARMNMPFELGIDYGCRRYGIDNLANKSVLILEHSHLDYHRAMSDISGWDIRAHSGDYIKAIRHVRNWLVDHANAQAIGAAKILNNYEIFQVWHMERELALGASVDDVKEYRIEQMVKAMREWVEAGRPIYDL